MASPHNYQYRFLAPRSPVETYVSRKKSTDGSIHTWFGRNRCGIVHHAVQIRSDPRAEGKRIKERGWIFGMI